MSQRHPHDDVTQLWVGASDPNDLRYVPIELRDLVAAVPPDVERKLRRQMRDTKDVIVSDPRTGKVTRTLQPHADDDDLEIAVVMRMNQWARAQLRAEQVAVEQARRDAAAHTCHACAAVVVPSAFNPTHHVQRRSLIDGSTIVVCGKCAAVAEQLAVERLAADQINGTSRADRVRKLIAAATS